MKKYSFLTLLSITFFLISAPKTVAQGIGIGVYPPISSIDALPPANISVPLSIENTSEDPLTVSLALRPFRPSSQENGNVEYLSDTSVFPSGDVLLLQRIKITDGEKAITKLTLSPKEVAEVVVTIPLSKQAVPGDYYFSVIFTGSATLPGLEENSQASVAQAGVASHILLSVGPKSAAKGQIVEFSSPFFLTHGPVPFTLRVENTSPHTIVPTGTVVIKNMFKQTVGQMELLPVNILSQSTRRIPDRKQLNEDGEIQEEMYEQFLLQQPKMLWQESFLLGIYTATVKAKLSDNGPILSQTTTFVAFPLPFLISFGIVILLVITIIQRVRANVRN